MESRDSFSEKEAGPAVPAGASGRIAVDRLELQHQWVQVEEEQRVEQALNLYARAARQHMQGAAPEPVEEDAAGPASEEEREALSQQLRLQQKCQDIAALIMVDELEDDLEEEEEVPKRKRREG